MMSMENGKSPGIDGLTVEFYKTLWPVIGEELLAVFNDSLKRGLLPLSCRRAVITLLPKKVIFSVSAIGALFLCYVQNIKFCLKL